MKVMFVIQAVKETHRGTSKKLNLYLKKKGHKTIFPYKKGKFWFFFYIFKFLIDYIKFRPDIIITFHQVAIIPIIYKKLGLINKPILHYWWDSYTEMMGRVHSPPLLAFIEYYVVKHSDFVVTNSKLQKSIADKLGIKCKYLQIGVEDYFFKKAKKIQLPGKNKFKVLYIGEQIESKGVVSLIKSVKGIKCDLIMLGNINSEFEKIASKNVYFLGFVKHTELPKYIASADITAFPSDQDSALKLFEYLASKKGILAYNGRINYILKYKENIFTTDNFSDGIRYLMKNPKIIKKIENGAKKFPVLRLKNVLKNHLEVIKGVKNGKEM